MSDEIERLRAEVVALREQYDGIEEERNAMDAVQDRAERAESERDALREHISFLQDVIKRAAERLQLMVKK